MGYYLLILILWGTHSSNTTVLTTYNREDTCIKAAVDIREHIEKQGRKDYLLLCVPTR